MMVSEPNSLTRLSPLTAHFNRVLAHLAGERDHALHESIDDTLAAGGALAQVCYAFGLTAFERDTLLLGAGVRLDPRFTQACAAWRKTTNGLPSLALAFDQFSSDFEEDRYALQLGGALRRYRLIEPVAQDGFDAFRLDERLLHYLLGDGTDDEPLSEVERHLPGISNLTPGEAPLARSHRAVVRDLGLALHEDSDGLVQVVSSDVRLVADLAARACAFLDRRAQLVPVETLLQGSDEVTARLNRERRLGGCVWIIQAGEALEPERADAWWQSIARQCALLEGVTVMVRRAHGQLEGTLLTLEVNRPSRSEQRTLWVAALGEANPSGGFGLHRAIASALLTHIGSETSPVAAMEARIDELVDQFDFGADRITEVAHAVTLTAAREIAHGGTSAVISDPRTMLWAGCRQAGRARMERLAKAERVQHSTERAKLILNEEVAATLDEIVIHVRQRHVVYERQGFSPGGRGRGVPILFSGPPGTGKTTAAEVLAGELDLDLYRIDLSAMVSKYIGETEKHMREVFDAAEEGGAILLFDEADSLFGKRGEVSDSSDRYANLEVSYLLQRMETYRGVAVLTSNLEGAIDEAFVRRLKFIVRFENPSEDERARVWQAAVPEAYHGGLDFELLAEFELSGANIHNAVQHAAFHACGRGETLSMWHVLRSVQRELHKLKRVSPESLRSALRELGLGY